MVDVLTGTFTVKTGHAQMLKGGVIMDVVNQEQAEIAAEAGAVAVMALERVPADIRADGGGVCVFHDARAAVPDLWFGKRRKLGRGPAPAAPYGAAPPGFTAIWKAACCYS